MAKQASAMTDPAFLEAALEGLQLQKQRIEKQISEVQGLLGRRRGRPSIASTAVAPIKAPAASKKKRELSDSARRRIATAQKKRWAEYRKKESPSKPA